MITGEKVEGRGIVVWKIGDIEIKNKICVAPMAGVTNAAFRTIVKEFGAGLVVCEMVSDKALVHRNKKVCKCYILNRMNTHSVSRLWAGIRRRW